MKQIVTIFRAEGEQANHLLRLCRSTRGRDLLGLCDSLRKQTRSSSLLTAYIEFLDEWSMGDDFTRIMGHAVRRRQTGAGELYFGIISPSMRANLQRQARRKHQFPEQAALARTVASLASRQQLPDTPAALALFREILRGSFQRSTSRM
jgi:hypothetical protein